MIYVLEILQMKAEKVLEYNKNVLKEQKTYSCLINYWNILIGQALYVEKQYILL